MPKRRCDSEVGEKLRKLRYKIRKLEQQRAHRSRRFTSCSSESSSSPSSSYSPSLRSSPKRRRIRIISSTDEESCIEERQRGGGNEDPLDDNFLELLGPNVALKEVEGSNMQNDLAVRWEAITKQGLNTEVRNTIIKDYPIPKNCQALNPPKLNGIVSAAISDAVARRDIRLSLNQTQIGAAASAVGLVVTTLLKDKKEEYKSIIKQLCDAGRLMADLFHSQSQYRRELLLFNLNKDLKDTLEKSELSTCLFGDKLEEEIKTSKSLQRTSEELRQPSSKTKKVFKPLNFRSLSRPNSGSARGRQNHSYPSQRSMGYNPRHQQPQSYPNLHNRLFYNHRQKERKSRRAPTDNKNR